MPGQISKYPKSPCEADHSCKSEVQEDITDPCVRCIPPSTEFSTREERES